MFAFFDPDYKERKEIFIPCSFHFYSNDTPRQAFPNITAFGIAFKCNPRCTLVYTLTKDPQWQRLSSPSQLLTESHPKYGCKYGATLSMSPELWFANSTIYHQKRTRTGLIGHRNVPAHVAYHYRIRSVNELVGLIVSAEAHTDIRRALPNTLKL
jgi:hypothetical protein